MPTTYNVRIWKTEKYEGSRVTTYRVRWRTDSRSWGKTFRTAAHGEVLQRASTGDMYRGVAELVAHCSRSLTFELGALILTRTPGGVGMFRESKRPLRPG